MVGQLSGILNVNKPAGVSSAWVVNVVKKTLGKHEGKWPKVGHAGTLDPFATGVLLVLVGGATKWCEGLMDQPKSYLATIRLGATSPTDDPDSPITPRPNVTPLNQDQITSALQPFIGKILQIPPVYSALKVAGRPAYQLARSGTPVTLRAREVTVYGIKIEHFSWPEMVVRVDCGRGVYIRKIARDLGESLGCGGMLNGLQRTAVGRFRVEECCNIEDIRQGGRSWMESRLQPLSAIQ